MNEIDRVDARINDLQNQLRLLAESPAFDQKMAELEYRLDQKMAELEYRLDQFAARLRAVEKQTEPVRPQEADR